MSEACEDVERVITLVLLTLLLLKLVLIRSYHLEITDLLFLFADAMVTILEIVRLDKS